MFIESKDLVGTIPTEMERLTNLNHLRLSNNKLTGTIPTVLGNLPLTTIMLGDNSLTGEIPTELGMIETLSFITLENNLLTGVIPPVLFNSRSLEIIYLGGNHLVGSIPSEIGELENVSMCKYISVLPTLKTTHKYLNDFIHRLQIVVILSNL